MNRSYSLFAALATASFLGACAAPTQTPSADANLMKDPALQPALASINAEGMMKPIRVLSSDEFEGRAPGSKGEELSVAYISKEFKAMGLAPGNPDGSYFQDVPLVGITSKPTLSLEVRGVKTTLQSPDEFVAFAAREKAVVDVDKSQLVYVGYGVQAPEYGWDDYKGLDVRGKTIVMLINDPQIPDPADPSKLDDKMFRGKAMTYYGRWTYKYEIAQKLGAAAAIIVHETPTAAYPWDVVRNSWGRENFAIQTVGPNPEFPDVSSWIQRDKAVKLFADCGMDFEAMKKAALSRDFKPVVMPATASFRVENTWRHVASRNVVAKMEGADPKLKDQWIVYSAHWDHLGIKPAAPGLTMQDRVYHGAVDNASGIASLLSFADAYTKLPQHPERSILFIATTSEEQGLLGAKYYASHPLYPLQKTLLNINVDSVNIFGRTSDVSTSGVSRTDLDPLLARLAAEQGRVVKPDPQPERGGFFRSDQFEFAKKGVPVVRAGSGDTLIGQPPGTGRTMIDDFTTHRYHQPTDVIYPGWDLSGAVEDMQLLFVLGYEVANGPGYPQWQADSEFKSMRDAMMK
jgi:Zn-dependent M28 family amino/carboxypeptidase